ncbi:Structural maintenance of chromosomes protein 4 [Strongyloides ratti]|uniref:Structural maintenance of chromosomes protein n=1 Tax=Strongyloides ratti TaxID=34506 RepID=A0A090KQH4_STRRB|nr:Structural maintenance of chromosomes protein 4 [Strongyloides ratti]CEF59634.1 Structural maintenance of chromosomes protein 4 [Strongyloides ratti]
MLNSYQDSRNKQSEKQFNSKIMEYDNSPSILESSSHGNDNSSNEDPLSASVDTQINKQNLYIRQVDDINYEEYSDLLSLEIPSWVNETVESNELQSRLIIDTIELENFKSFYGVKKIGPLSTNLSCIIGPNGSGKSNIFDSLLFVFDYNIRKCRAKKAAEFIHKSSQGNCTYAKVTVNFKRIKNDGIKYIDVQDSFFSISRQITESNRSTFYFNGSTINKNDLKNILKKQGFGLDYDRFLILQGEVEKISLLKPKADKQGEDSLLDFLDEIIGTSRFKEPIERINEAISHLQMKITAINAKIRDCERIKSMVETKVKESIKQMRINNAFTDLKYKKYFIELTRNQEICQQIKEKIQKYQEDVNGLNKEVSTVEQEIQKYENDKFQSMKELDRLRRETSDVKQRLNRNDIDLQAVCSKISITEDSLKKYEKKSEELQKEIMESQTVLLNIIKEKEETEKKLIENDKLEIVYEKNKREAEENFYLERSKYVSEINFRDEEFVKAKNDVNRLKNEEAKLQIDMEQMTIKKRNIEEEIKDIQLSITSLISTKNFEIEKKEKLIKEINEIEKKTYNLEEDLVYYELKIKKNSDNISSKTLEYNELSKEYESLIDQEKFSPASEVTQYLYSLNYPGFKGRLGDLASIDKKYDVALSTLGGWSLNMYVVNEVTDGQYLIDELKRTKKGKGTFICINEMKKRFNNKNIEKKYFPGIVRAIDMLQNVSPEILPCFEYVFRDSLIVDNVDMAVQYRENSNRYIPKIVTLDGCVFESSGKITGGGKPISGLIGRKNYHKTTMSDKSKADLKIELSNLNDMINDLKMLNVNVINNKAKINGEIKKNRATLDSMKVEHSIMEKSIFNLDNILKTKQDIVIDKQKDLSNVVIDENAYNDINRKITNLKSVIIEKQLYLSDKEKEYNNIKEKVSNIYKNLVQKHVSDFEKCLIIKKECQDNINDFKKKTIHLSKMCERKKLQQDTNEEEMQRLKSLLENYQISEQRFNEMNCNLMDELSELYRKAEELVNKTNQRDNIKKQRLLLTDLKDKIFKNVHLIEDEEKKLNDYCIKQISYKKEIENLNYLFYNSMHLLPPELICYKNDEQFYSKRVDEAEKEFIYSLKNETYNEPLLMVSVSLKTFAKEELQHIINDKEKIDVEMGIISPHCDGISDTDVIAMYLEKEKLCLTNRSIYRKMNNIYENLQKKASIWRSQRIQEFFVGLKIISDNVKNVYQAITFGGDAELQCCDMLDPYNFGISYKIRPPNKSWRKLNNLSGGEKTLASLALIFGLHEYNPTPLYIMDEIDASLDFRNVSVIGRYIKQKTSNAQFIVVSLRKEMYELADKCICIWKVKDETVAGSYDVEGIVSEIKNWTNLRDIDLNKIFKKNLESLSQLLSIDE